LYKCWLSFSNALPSPIRKPLPEISSRTATNSKMDREKPKLYRKVNTRAKGVRHHFGGDFKDSRNCKRETLQQAKGTMFGTKERELDYTPLFKFLLSKVGSNWNEVFSEAKSRLDKQEPTFWIVALNDEEKKIISELEDRPIFLVYSRVTMVFYS
jgi:hypothetical protein